MSNADQIRVEQEKLDQIRRETEKKGQEFIAEMREKLRAQKEARADGGIDRDAQREILREAQKRTDEFKDRLQRQQDQEKRERQAKADRNKTDEQKRDDQRKAEQQKADDQRAEDIRAQAREKARTETERLVKEGLDRHVSDRQEKIMAGTSHGPAMTPGMNDPIRMAAAMDHPGLTDDQKLILSKAGYAVGEGWHNRETERKEELMQAERQKRDDARESAPEKRQEQEDKGRDDFFADHYSNKDQEKSQEQARPQEQKQGDREQQQDQQQRPDFFAEHYSSKTDKTDEQRAAEAVKARDDAVSDVKDAVKKEHTDQQVGETARDIKERADLEATGKVTVAQAEEMTHGKGSHEAENRKFEKWYDKHETEELDKAGVSRDPKDYEKDYEQERDR